MLLKLGQQIAALEVFGHCGGPEKIIFSVF